MSPCPLPTRRMPTADSFGNQLAYDLANKMEVGTFSKGPTVGPAGLRAIGRFVALIVAPFRAGRKRRGTTETPRYQSGPQCAGN